MKKELLPKKTSLSTCSITLKAKQRLMMIWTYTYHNLGPVCVGSLNLVNQAYSISVC